MTAPNPDPLRPSDVDAAYDSGFIDGVAHASESRSLMGLVLVALSAAIVGAILAVVVVHAAPRPALLPLIPVADAGRIGPPQDTSGLGRTHPPSGVGAALASAAGPCCDAPTDPPAIAGGLASYVAPSYGPRYLALPDGPGIRVTICGPAACVTRTSTDAGPDLAMQRAGRVADTSWADFRALCGCDPASVGVIRVTISDASGPAPTPPATDTDPVE